jgi:hypothetical protein
MIVSETWDITLLLDLASVAETPEPPAPQADRGADQGHRLRTGKKQKGLKARFDILLSIPALGAIFAPAMLIVMTKLGNWRLGKPPG